MSNGQTIKERLTRIETLLENHIAHDEQRHKWTLRIFGGFITGFVLMVTPGFIQWLGGVL